MKPLFQTKPLMRVALRISGVLAALFLSACATTEQAADSAPDISTSAWARLSQADGVATEKPSQWLHFTLPGKQPNTYRPAKHDGRDAVRVQSDAAISVVRQRVLVPPHELGSIKFSWKVPQLIATADLAVRELSDSPVRLVLAFDGDRSRFSAKNSMLSELSHVLTGEPMPYATLMYVWCNQCARESVIHNTRTDRIQKIAIESGSKNLNQWLDYERDIRADFQKDFGEAPGTLVGIGIMTDTDNTRSAASAWYGKVQLVQQGRAVQPPKSADKVEPLNTLTSAK